MKPFFRALASEAGGLFEASQRAVQEALRDHLSQVRSGQGATRIQQALMQRAMQPIESTLSTFYQNLEWWRQRPVDVEPALLAAYMREKSPIIAELFLHIASSLQNPLRLLLGMELFKLGGEEVVATINRPGAAGLKHGDAGALVSLSHFAAEIFWRQFLDLQNSTFDCAHLTVRRVNEGAPGPLRARLRVSEGRREALFFELRSRGFVNLPIQVDVLDSGGLLVAEVEWTWQARRPVQIAAESRSTSEEGASEGSRPIAESNEGDNDHGKTQL